MTADIRTRHHALFQAANKLKKLEGLDKLVHLATLHLRDNQIDALDGFSAEMKNLQYVNFRSGSDSVCFRASS